MTQYSTEDTGGGPLFQDFLEEALAFDVTALRMAVLSTSWGRAIKSVFSSPD